MHNCAYALILAPDLSPQHEHANNRSMGIISVMLTPIPTPISESIVPDASFSFPKLSATH